MPIDTDLQGIWQFHPRGANRDATIMVTGQPVPVIMGGEEDYGDEPYLFRASKQNGSRIHFRLQRDGKDAKYPADHDYLAGTFVERRAYTSDVRRGVYWTREEGEQV